MLTVVQTDAAASGRDVEDGVFAASGLPVEFLRSECTCEDDVVAHCARADALLAAYVPLTARVLAELTRCRHIAYLATGYNSVDLDAATKLGIVVTHVPDYCTAEVADHTLGLLLSLGRNIARLQASVRAGEWDYEAAGRPERLSDLTLGIIGLGRIGRAVAARAGAFGLRVVAADPYVDAAAMRVVGATKVELADVLACDIVSLHCALTSETRGIVDAAALARMKPSAFLINTARGGCVETDALVDALRRGVIAGAGLDVVDPEPLPVRHPLRDLPNVVLTPHAAFMSRHADREAREKACRQIVTALRGDTPEHVCNPGVLSLPQCRLRGESAHALR